MAYLLRIIKPKCWKYKTDDFKNIKSIPADPISDINTNNQTLSFYKINDYNHIPEEIIAGYASKRGSLQELQVVAIDEEAFPNSIFTLKPIKGNTPHDDANTAHRELVNLKAKNLIPIVRIIFKYIIKEDRVTSFNKGEVEKIVKSHINDTNFHQEQLQETMKKQLGLMAVCVTCGK